MREDNNPFRPTLAKPVDDSVLANDPAADNFLAGNDRLGNQTQAATSQFGGTIDNVKPAATQAGNSTTAQLPTLHLDQMLNSNNGGNLFGDTNTMATPNNLTITNAGLDSLSSTDNTPSTPATQPSNIFEALAAQADGAAEATAKPTDKDKSGDGKKRLLGRKKKATKASGKKIDPAKATASVFGTSLGADANTGTSTTSPLGFDPLDPTSPTAANADSMTEPATTTPAADNSPLAPLPDTSLGDAVQPSPIETNLAAAANAADSKIDTSPHGKSATKKPAGKNGQPKQLTISLLTIVFFVLFVAATGAAIYFGMQNSKNSTALSDAEAKLEELNDKANNSTNSSNKASDQFSALQDKIADLTTQNEQKQKTLDENTKTIEDLNKKNSDLNTQLTAAQNKLTSDTQVSDSMKSLLTTLCTNDDFRNSSACVALNGGQANTGNQPTTPATQPGTQQ